MDRTTAPFSKTDIDDIRQAIMLAELDTSAEIHVHIGKNCTGSCEEKAAEIFAELKLDQTVDRNGILIYLAYHNRRFCIYADTGIQKKVSEDFWISIKQNFLNRIRQGQFTDGLIEVIQQCGIKLKKLFPRNPGDLNQLSDEVTFS